MNKLEWQGLSGWITEKYGCNGLLLYGSAARDCASTSSDIDLLCLWTETYVRVIQTTYRGYDLDITIRPRTNIIQALNAQEKGNENYVLRAFVEGQILYDSTFELEELSRLARKIWEMGPTAVGTQERMKMIARTKKVILLLARLKRSSHNTSFENHYCDIRLALLLDMLVKDYCRVFQLWSSSLKDLFTTGNEKYSEIRAILLSYMRHDETEQRICTLENLAGIIHKAIALAVQT